MGVGRTFADMDKGPVGGGSLASLLQAHSSVFTRIQADIKQRYQEKCKYFFHVVRVLRFI